MRATGTESRASSNVLVGMGWDEVGQGDAVNSRQGGVFRQLEGIRVSDRDLSDAAVAVAD